MKHHLRLDTLQIDGFGHFHEFQLELSPGLNVLYGANEVGKSTLLAFVRSVLFGFARRNTPERYEPIGGKTFGGRVLLSTPHGELWVQRLGGRKAEGELTVKNGVMARVPESRLNEALAGVDRALFEQVFSFGLDELRSWGQLMEAGNVKEALAAASMQGALRLPEALARLEPDAQELWSARAAKKPLTLALTALAQVRARRLALGDRPREYFAAQEALAATRVDEARLQQQLELASREEFGLERLAAAAADVERAVRAEALAAELPGVERFPEQGAARLDEVLATHEAARGARARAADAAAGLEAPLGSLAAQARGRPPAGPIAAAVEGWRAVASLERELPSRAAQLSARARRLEEQRARLGLGGPLERVDTSVAARARLAALRSSGAEAAERTLRAEETARAATGRREELERELAALQAERSALGAEGSGPSRAAALEAARALGNLEHEARVVDAQLEDRRTALGAAEVPDEPAPAERFPLSLVAPAGLLLLALAGAAWALAGAGAGAAAIGFALALCGLLAALHHRDHTQWLSMRSAYTAVVRHRGEHRARLQLELQTVRARQAALVEQLERARAIAGVVPGAPTAARLAQLEREEGQAGQLHQLERALQLTQARLQPARDEESAATAAVAAARGEQAAGAQLLAQALTQLGLPLGLSPSGALELLAEAAAAQGSAGALADEQAAHQRECARVERAGELLDAAATLAKLEGPARAERLALLTGWLEQTTALGAEQATLRSRLADAQATLAAADAEARRAAARLEALLAAAGTADLEQFRKLGAAAVAAAAASAEARGSAARVRAACGLEVAEAHAALLVPPGVTARLAAARQHREGVEAERRAVHERRGSLTQQLSGLESDAELARLLREEQALAARAEQLARRVAVARLGRAVLGQAREKFEAEHQPQLIRRAAETFQAITLGHFPKVAIDPGSRALQVIDSLGHHFSPEQLSRGTREQLLAALRLAMIEDFGQQRLALPVLVDDVLVNFDRDRAEQMIAALARLAQKHQVIAFTCHPHFKELFKEHGAKAIEVSTRAQLALLPS